MAGRAGGAGDDREGGGRDAQQCLMPGLSLTLSDSSTNEGVSLMHVKSLRLQVPDDKPFDKPENWFQSVVGTSLVPVIDSGALERFWFSCYGAVGKGKHVLFRFETDDLPKVEREGRASSRRKDRVRRVLQGERPEGRRKGGRRSPASSSLTGCSPGAARLPRAGSSPTGCTNVPRKISVLHLGLPDAGRDDHRPVEPNSEAVPIRGILLRPEVVLGLQSRPDQEGSRPQGHELGGGGLGR